MGIWSASTTPITAATAPVAASPDHMAVMRRVGTPASSRLRVPAAPSGTLENTTAARNATLTPSPAAMPMPRMKDSGIPSSRAPRNMAVPDPCAASLELMVVRSAPPARSTARSARK